MSLLATPHAPRDVDFSFLAVFGFLLFPGLLIMWMMPNLPMGLRIAAIALCSWVFYFLCQIFWQRRRAVGQREKL
jgi:hypothetical protein